MLMTENVTNELMYGVLKEIQGTLKEHSEQFKLMNQRLSAIDHHMVGFHVTVAGHQEEIQALRSRIDLIEKRLEIRDPTNMD